MDAKKILGVVILVGIIVAFGVVIVRQMGSVPREMSLDTPKTVMPKNVNEIPAGLTEEPQAAVMDTKQPATVDAIVGDISKEADSDTTVMSNEAAGETAVVNDESGSLNEVSKFYDDTNL